MDKTVIREALCKEGDAVGSATFELEQLRMLQESQMKDRIQGFETISLTCGGFFTIMCCN